MKTRKAEKLLEVAGKSLDRGDTESAREVAVLALRQEDAIDALDRLLPSHQEPDMEFEEDFEEEDEELNEAQIAKITALAKEIEAKKKTDIVNQILSKLEKYK